MKNDVIDPTVLSLDPNVLTKAEWNEARKYAVTLIYSVFWQGKSVPTSLKWLPRGWSLAAELRIWNKLARNYGPVQVNGAMTIAREVLGIPSQQPMTMLLFHKSGMGTKRLQWCIDVWSKKRLGSDDGKRADHVLRDILRGSG